MKLKRSKGVKDSKKEYLYKNKNYRGMSYRNITKLCRTDGNNARQRLLINKLGVV